MRASVRKPGGASDGQLCPPVGQRAVNHHLRKRLGLWRKGTDRNQRSRHPTRSQNARRAMIHEHRRYHELNGCSSTGRSARGSIIDSSLA